MSSNNSGNDLIELARNGDIKAFHELFTEVKDKMRAYLYRIVTNRDDVEDLVHDTFVKGFDSIKTFRRESSINTWLFSIATHLAINQLKNGRPWPIDILDRAKEEATRSKKIRDYLWRASENQQGTFDIIEHIDFCFTCISKTIVLEQQVTLLLVDVFDFKIKEVAVILEKSEAAVKHYLRKGRHTMANTFEMRCALVNKKGACHQCSQLNSWFNPRQKEQEAIVRQKFENVARDSNLLEVRELLIKSIDPLKAKGTLLHEAFMNLHRKCAGEIKELKPL